MSESFDDARCLLSGAKPVIRAEYLSLDALLAYVRAEIAQLATTVRKAK